MKRTSEPTTEHSTRTGTGRVAGRISAGLAALLLFAVPAACSDDDPTNVVDGSEFVDETPGESFSVDSQADLACVNAFDAAANDEAPLATTLEACVDAEQWYDVASQYTALVPSDQEAEVLEDLCAQSDETLETFC